MTLGEDLRHALDEATAAVDRAATTAAVERLIARYRKGGAAHEPILATAADVTAYAAYRMPATFGAVRAALTQVALTRPDLRPASLLDLGGGTGAAAWAGCDVFPGLTQVTVVDQVTGALELGRSLARSAGHDALRSATWRAGRLDQTQLPSADLVTVSYVLSELSPQQRCALLAAAADHGDTVCVIEPGTPDGYRRILAAREQLVSGGSTVVAPCPHDGACPLAGDDWCHFAARINRSALHRRIKRGELGHEDEKFSYVVVAPSRSASPAARVLRHPAKRKGLVQLELCRPDGTASREIVSKRQGPLYRAARDVEWGDAWPE
jgi:ribosomal protein RSM22 (predicted rRNA methylase)